MRCLLLLMAVPSFAYAGTLAAHSNDFKALEILETSQPPPARKPAPKPKPKQALAAKPKAPEPSAEAKALDALMAAGPEGTSAPAAAPKPVPAAEPAPAPKAASAPKPAPAPKPIPKPAVSAAEPELDLEPALAPKPVAAPKRRPAPRPAVAQKRTIEIQRPMQIVAKPKNKTKQPKAKPTDAATVQRVPTQLALKTKPTPSRYVNYRKAKAAPQNFAMTSTAKSNTNVNVPSSIEFQPETDEIDPVAPPARLAIAAPNPSADSDALDALIASTPGQPTRAARPVMIPASEDTNVDIEETRRERPPRNMRYSNGDYEYLAIDPDEIRREPARKIQNLWY